MLMGSAVEQDHTLLLLYCCDCWLLVGVMITLEQISVF